MTRRVFPKNKVLALKKAVSAVCVAAALLFTPVAAWASAFTIPAIPVDVTAESPTEARQKAILQGEAIAFARLLQTVISAEDRVLIPELSPEELEALVADFSVSNEKSSATRYIATMTVNFDEKRVAQLLKNFGVTLVQGGEQTVILLGLYQADPEAPVLLWEDDNPWRLLLNQTAVSRALFPVAVPMGDLVDMGEVTAEAALALDQTALAALLERYGADTVVVAHVTTTPEEGSKMVLHRYPQDMPPRFHNGSTPISDDLTAALGDLAAHAVLAVAQSEKVQRQGIMVGETDSLATLIPVQGVADWVRVESTLNALPMVQSVQLRASRTDVVQAAISYAGSLDDLHMAVEKLGFGVNMYDGYWEILPSPETATPVLP